MWLFQKNWLKTEKTNPATKRYMPIFLKNMAILYYRCSLGNQAEGLERYHLKIWIKKT